MTSVFQKKQAKTPNDLGVDLSLKHNFKEQVCQCVRQGKKNNIKKRTYIPDAQSVVYLSTFTPYPNVGK